MNVMQLAVSSKELTQLHGHVVDVYHGDDIGVARFRIEGGPLKGQLLDVRTHFVYGAYYIDAFTNKGLSWQNEVHDPWWNTSCHRLEAGDKRIAQLLALLGLY